jgi:hypothetical protein
MNTRTVLTLALVLAATLCCPTDSRAAYSRTIRRTIAGVTGRVAPADLPYVIRANDTLSISDPLNLPHPVYFHVPVERPSLPTFAAVSARVFGQGCMAFRSFREAGSLFEGFSACNPNPSGWGLAQTGLDLAVYGSLLATWEGPTGSAVQKVSVEWTTIGN